MSKRKPSEQPACARTKVAGTRSARKAAKRTLTPPADRTTLRIGTLLRGVKRTGPYWAVIRTKSGRENYAKQNLVRQGFEVYYPRYQPSGRGQLEALFRTYIFVRIIDQWLKIESTYGVSGILKTDGVPTRVPLKVIHALKRMENPDGVVKLQTQRQLVKGEPVEIVKGAFKGQIMLYDGDTAEGRIKALYEFLGSKLVVEFNRNYVAPAGALELPPGVEP